MKACYRSQMKKIDADASVIGGIPSIVLMENAAIACVDQLKKEYGTLNKKQAVIFCGCGNNGGDGFAIARHLLNLGADVHVYLVCGNAFSGDCLINYEIIKKMNCSITELTNTGLLNYQIKAADIVIDAIYGTGVHGVITGLAYDVIAKINEYASYIMSVDIPSGINSDTGEICGICIHADKTVTFAAYKVGMFLFPGCEYTGEIVVSDISIPQYIIEQQAVDIHVTDDVLIKNLFPKRTQNSQKGDYGKVLVIGGSKGMTGAAYLSCQAALMSGSGLVTLGIPESLNAIMEGKLTEVMTLPLLDTDGHISKSCLNQVIAQMERSGAVLFGPGLGKTPDVTYILEKILSYSEIPVIIDADGLNVLSEKMEMLSNCNCPLILTPHSVEMARLSQSTLEEVEADRIACSDKFVQENGVNLILKGHHTIVTAMNGTKYINTTGNSGMATGGSGDVLAGMTASFVARGIEEAHAAVLAVYLHGKAGDFARDRLGEDSVTPQSIIDYIPYAIKSVYG